FRNRFMVLILLFLGICLNQSNVIFGMNISFADFFALIVIMYLTFKSSLYIPKIHLAFFLILSIFVIFTTVYYVPIKFSINTNPIGIINNYAKLLGLFAFLILGYNLSRLGKIKIVLKWYAIFGLLIGTIGVLYSFLNISVFSNVLFFADIRYRGLMNDPNYFAILQITALVYFSRVKSLNPVVKFLAMLIFILAVLVSGSKTGLIVLVCYFVFRVL